MNAEARCAPGSTDTVYRTPHGLDKPGAHSSARDVLKLAQLDMASPVFRGLAGPQDGHDPRPPAADEQHAAAAYASLDGVKTGHTDEAGGTSRRAPIGTECGCTRSCSARPTRRSAIATWRACSTGATLRFPIPHRTLAGNGCHECVTLVSSGSRLLRFRRTRAN